MYACYWILLVLLSAVVSIVNYGVSSVIYASSAAVIYGSSLFRYIGAGIVSCGTFVLYPWNWTSFVVEGTLPSPLSVLTLLLTAFVIKWAISAKGFGTIDRLQSSWRRSATEGTFLNRVHKTSDSSKSVVNFTHDTI